MENQIFFIIIIIVILGIYYIHITDTNNHAKLNEKSNSEENFDIVPNQDNISECVRAGTGTGDLLTLNPLQRCEILGKKKFMVRDLRTKLWLISGQEEGFNKFLPGRFGVLCLKNQMNIFL